MMGSVRGNGERCMHEVDNDGRRDEMRRDDAK